MTTGKWKPVSEPPELKQDEFGNWTSDKLLMYVAESSIYNTVPYYAIGTYCGITLDNDNTVIIGSHWCDGIDYYADVTHWMELPQKPED